MGHFPVSGPTLPLGLAKQGALGCCSCAADRASTVAAGCTSSPKQLLIGAQRPVGRRYDFRPEVVQLQLACAVQRPVRRQLQRKADRPGVTQGWQTFELRIAASGSGIPASTVPALFGLGPVQRTPCTSIAADASVTRRPIDNLHQRVKKSSALGNHGTHPTAGQVQTRAG